MGRDVVEGGAAKGVKLIISVDTGIRAGEVVRTASALGIDVIVTDHHLPESELPPALAVLNPNRPDCPYPEKNLCGAGVAFKLVQALLGRTGWAFRHRLRGGGLCPYVRALSRTCCVVLSSRRTRARH